MSTIYRAGPQLRRVRFVAAITTLMSVAVVWAGFYTMQHMGLAPAEGGVLKPLAVRLLVGGAFIAFGIACLVGMWIYGQCYVTMLATAEDPPRLIATFAGYPRTFTEEFLLEDVGESAYQHGSFDTGRLRGEAPWISIRIRGRRLPLIVDAQGEVLDGVPFHLPREAEL